MNIKELQSVVNPIYTTAKGLLGLLISGGEPDALKLAPHINLAELRPKLDKTPPPEILNCFKIGQMARFDINNSAALKSGKQTIIDLPCGYTTRCFKVADNGQKYYGFDLPIVIDEIKDWTSKIMTEEQKSLISFNAVDATNYNSLRNALKDVKGEICIITEGLLSYFSDSELISMCQAIYQLLAEFGGCWITADGTEMYLIYPLVLSVVYQGDKEKVLSMMKELSSSMANVNAFTNTFSANKFAKAKEFLEKQGFIIKEESISKYMDKLKCVPEDKEAILRETLGSKINIWTMTIDKKDEKFENNEEKIEFKLETKLEENIFKIDIKGRLDTLTAPELLQKFKENKDIKNIKINVNEMTFISSAGIRVFQIMIKELENKDLFEINGTNENVKKNLIENGFESNIK